MPNRNGTGNYTKPNEHKLLSSSFMQTYYECTHFQFIFFLVRS